MPGQTNLNESRTQEKNYFDGQQLQRIVANRSDSILRIEDITPIIFACNLNIKRPELADSSSKTKTDTPTNRRRYKSNDDRLWTPAMDREASLNYSSDYSDETEWTCRKDR